MTNASETTHDFDFKDHSEDEEENLNLSGKTKQEIKVANKSSLDIQQAIQETSKEDSVTKMTIIVALTKL
jgi:hypothetical protein